MTTLTLEAGSLAYYDSVTAGLVPVRIESIDAYPSGLRILVRTTAARGHITRGYLIDAGASWVLPRQLRRIRGSYGQRVITPPVQFVATRGAAE